MQTSKLLRRYRHFIAAVMLVIFSQWAVRPAEAHNSWTHEQMALAAYTDMRLISENNIHFADDLISDPPSGVSAADWKKFIQDIAAAYPKLNQLKSNDPKLTKLTDDLTSEYIFELKIPAPDRPSPVALQLMASATIPDNNINDTHLQTKLGSVAGINMVLKPLDELLKASVLVMIIPIICVAEVIWSFFSGDDSDCLKDAKNLAEKTPTASDFYNLIPGFGDYTDGDYAGLWHFINLSDSSLVENNYDDHQGMLYEVAGPNQRPGCVDWLIMAGADLVGRSVNPEKSDGVQHYQIAKPNDAFKDGDSYNGSVKRNEFTWEKYTVAHTPFSPVDNLALYGWQQFRDKGHDLAYLGYPLHALGDATVPMHVACTTSWGHRPFEDAVSKSWTTLSSPLRITNKALLSIAFHYRQEILQWRAQGHPGDIPVRHLVREVAQHTLAYSKAAQKKTGDWPFNDTASRIWHRKDFTPIDLDDANIKKAHDEAIALYLRPDATELLTPLLADGIGAQIAFLMSAVETGGIAQNENLADPSFKLVGDTERVTKLAATKSFFPSETLDAPLKPKKFDPPTPAANVAQTEYSRLAALLVLGKMSPAEYLFRVRRVTHRLHEAEVKGDTSGKGIVDTRPLPRGTVLPPAPSSREIQPLFAGLKIMMSPKCVDQPRPATPVLKELGYDNQMKQFLLVVNPVSEIMKDCPMFYQFEVRFSGGDPDSSVPVTALKKVVFADWENKAPNAGGKTPLIFRLSHLVTSDKERGFVQPFARFYPTIEWRARAVNANGISSEWSQWQKQQKSKLDLP